MTITLEFLNAVEGRPEWLGQWFAMPNLTRDREQIGWSAVCSKELFGYAQLYLKLDGRVDVRNSDLTATQLLEFATYARRVEIEAERRMSLNPTCGDFTKDEFPPDVVVAVWVKGMYLVDDWAYWPKSLATWCAEWQGYGLDCDLEGPWSLEKPVE